MDNTFFIILTLLISIFTSATDTNLNNNTNFLLLLLLALGGSNNGCGCNSCCGSFSQCPCQNAFCPCGGLSNFNYNNFI